MWFQKKRGLHARIQQVRRAVSAGRKKEISGPALIGGIALGAWLVGSSLARQRRKLNFNSKVVVITGGSRGLGLEMARILAQEGARVAILARNEPELELVRAELEITSKLVRVRNLAGREDMPSGSRLTSITSVLNGPALAGARSFVLAIPCDVGQREQVESAIRQVVDTFGTVDVLINAAGIIQVAPLEHLTVEDYRDAMDVHFWGPLYTMLAVIPIMRRVGGGRIVNIASIGGKVAVPHLAPYVASKFALDGLSDAFRAELARDNILVSTINPGLMRTGSYYHANFKGQQPKEFAWFSLLSSLPVTAMSSKRAAQQVLNAARYGIPERTLTLQARLLQLVDELFPGLMSWVMQFTNERLLPAPGGPLPEELMTGYETRRMSKENKLRGLGEKAAERNNETIAERTL
jgi:NAD(P)-dependent dehydrogenase (short-subunit alcohol dehydrogenase family)